jgi:hypothetical protein
VAVGFQYSQIVQLFSFFIPNAINDGDAVSQWIRSQPVQYIYLGRRGGILKASFFEHQPERYTLVYNADGIRIFWVTSD